MPQISGSSVYPVSQDGESSQGVPNNGGHRLSWCSFGGMAISAMVIIAMGTVTQGRGPWDWKYISYAIH